MTVARRDPRTLLWKQSVPTKSKDSDPYYGEHKDYQPTKTPSDHFQSDAITSVFVFCFLFGKAIFKVPPVTLGPFQSALRR